MDSKPRERTGTMESTAIDKRERPIPNIKKKSPSINKFDVNGAINTAAVEIAEPIMYTALWPYFSQKCPPKKLPAIQPIVLRLKIMLMAELLILNSSMKKGMKFPLELSKRAIVKYR